MRPNSSARNGPSAEFLRPDIEEAWGENLGSPDLFRAIPDCA